MTENEKLRALLAEARHEIATWHLGPRDPLIQRIDAALAEPVIECARCEESEHAMHLRIRAGYDKTVADSWRAKVAEVERERDEARAEVRRTYKELSESIAREAEAFERGAEAMREAAASKVFAFYAWSKDNEATRTDIKNLAELIDAMPVSEGK